MSTNVNRVYPVIEWSPTSVTLFDSASKAKTEAANLASLVTALKGQREVVIALSRRTSFIRTAHLPNAAKEEVNKILALQIGQLVPIEASEVASDFVFTDQVSSEGRLALIVATSAEVLRQLHREAGDCGLKVVTVLPAALGSAEVLRSLGLANGAVVQQTNEGLAIDLVESGQLKASRVAAQTSDIVGEVKRTFAMSKTPVYEIVAAGGLSFSGEDRKTEMSSLVALGRAVPQVHLELPEEVAKRAKSKVDQQRRLALLLWTAAIGVAAVVWDIRSTAADVKLKGEKKWVAIMRSLNATDKQAEAKLSTLRKTEDALRTAFEPKQRLGDVLAIASSLAPEGLWLTGITLERGKPAQFRGTAVTGDAVSGFLDHLSKESRFRDARLVFANNATIEESNVVQFAVSSHVVGNFPAFTVEDRRKR